MRVAKCPKCSAKLSPLDWRQECPSCGVNLMFYGFEERFYSDAKIAEMSLAAFRVKLEKVKVGLIGGKLAVARLAVVLLPVLALLVPFGSITFSIPIYQKEISLGAIGLYKAFTDGSFALLGKITGAMIIGNDIAILQKAFFAFLAAALFVVLLVLLTVVAFISFKKMAAIICALTVPGAVCAVAAQIMFAKLADVGGLIDVKTGFGVYILCASLAAVFALNAIIAVKGLPIQYKEGDLERVEAKRRLKRKEITLDDLSCPIYETEQEKLERAEKILKTLEDSAKVSEVSTVE